MSLANGDGMGKLVDSTMLKVLARVIQVIGVPLACVLLTIYLQNSSAQRDRINDTLSKLTSAVDVLNAKTGNLYTSDDAKGDFALRDERIENVRVQVNDLGIRVDGNTHRIEALEAARRYHFTR